jgi:hypothetical protein
LRDFKAGRDINVSGDLVVTDQSQESKPLARCSNQELFEEEKHRKDLLASERSDRSKKSLTFMAIAALMFFGAALWYWVHGKIDVFSLLGGGASIILALATIRFGDEPTPFEVRQLAALEEIHMLLRERNVRR